jgi:hypothetical protein
MVRWNVIRAGLPISPDTLFAPLAEHPEIVLERIAIPEILIEELIIQETVRLQIATDDELRTGHRAPGPHGFAVSLQAYVNKVAGACPLCGHIQEKDFFDEEETLIE